MIVASACTHTPRYPNQGNVVSPIDSKSFKIYLPPNENWEKWQLTKKEEPESIVLEKLKIWPFNGEAQGTTSILVARNHVAEGGHNFTEKEIADNIRSIEKEIMDKEGEGQDLYKIKELSLDDIEHNGKTLYSMKYTLNKGSAIGASFKRTFFVKSVLYIYFPENYKINHNSYLFLINEAYIPGTFIPINVDQIFPIIDGFEEKNKS